MNKLEGLQLFCRVAELNSYSAVARERSMSRSGVSRSIAQLEKEFGIQLFKRSTRTLVLTEPGHELYIESERILRQFEALEDRICRDRSEVRGLLRVGVPGPLSERFLLPDLEEFNQRYPDVNLFLQVSEGLSDLFRDELDMVIRMGVPKDSSLMSIQLSEMNFVVVAAPSYLAKNITIEHPEQLKDLNCLCFKGRGRGTTLSFKKESEKVTVPISGFVGADCGYSLRSLAVSGLGVVAMPLPLIKKELESGELVPLLKNWELKQNTDNWGVHLLYHADRRPLRRVRAFIDFMKEKKRLIHTCNKLAGNI